MTYMATSNANGNGLGVALFGKEPSFREQVSAALVSGGHSVLARSPTGEDLPVSWNGKVPACIVVAAERPDRSTLDLVRLLRSRLGEVSAVLVCRRAVIADVGRARAPRGDRRMAVLELGDAEPHHTRIVPEPRVELVVALGHQRVLVGPERGRHFSDHLLVVDLHEDI